MQSTDKTNERIDERMGESITQFVRFCALKSESRVCRCLERQYQAHPRLRNREDNEVWRRHSAEVDRLVLHHGRL
jgi:hypothetical protein